MSVWIHIRFGYHFLNWSGEKVTITCFDSFFFFNQHLCWLFKVLHCLLPQCLRRDSSTTKFHTVNILFDFDSLWSISQVSCEHVDLIIRNEFGSLFSFALVVVAALSWRHPKANCCTHSPRNRKWTVVVTGQTSDTFSLSPKQPRTTHRSECTLSFIWPRRRGMSRAALGVFLLRNYHLKAYTKFTCIVSD